MSTISVSNIQTANGTENLTATTGNTTGSRVIVTASGGIVLGSNSTINSVVVASGSAANTLVVNSTGSYFTGNLSVSSGSISGSFGAITTTSLTSPELTTSNGTTNLILDTGNTTAGGIVIRSGGGTTITSNSTANAIDITASGNVNIDNGVLFVDSSGNRVGVNNTTPDASLTVTGTANVSGAFRVDGITTLAANAVLSGTLQTIAGNTNFDSGVLFVDATNNRVGVGRTDPDANLSVTGTANVSGAVRFGGITTLAANAVLSGALQTIAGNTNFDSGVLFVDGTNNRVGVGRTDPDANLAVQGTANVSGVARFGANVTVVGNLNISSTLANTGWVMLNSGLKMNWGVIAANSSTLGNATFSSAFASGPYSVTMAGANSLGNTCWSAGTNSTVVQVRSSSTTSTGGLVYWMAIGI